MAPTAAVESLKTVATRQGDMFRAAMEDFQHNSDVLGCRHRRGEDRQADRLAKKSYEVVVANTKELADLYSKGQAEAFETLSCPRSS